MQHAAVSHEDHGRVRVIRLNRPPSNPLNEEMFKSISLAVDQAAESDGVGAIVLASGIPKYFSSGLDLDALFSTPEDRRLHLFQTMIDLHRKIAAASKPTVAAIEGYALLGGYVVALGCDWRYIAAETGRIALSEIRLGISPTLPLIKLVCGLSGRPGLVKELILRGQTLRADQAHEAGLADHVLPKEGFLAAVIKEAEKLAKLPPSAYASIKRDLRTVLLAKEDDLWKEGLKEFIRLFTGPEGREGMLAMKEKRKPRWE